MLENPQFILASSSPHRLRLLQSISVNPDKIISPDIDESPLAKEKPPQLALRLAERKAFAVAQNHQGDGLILGADTVVATKSRNFDKALSREDVVKHLQFFSGRRIHVYTGISVIRVKNSLVDKIATKLVDSVLKFKVLTPAEIEYYVNTDHGIGVAGGLAIDGLGEAFIQWMRGSYSGIIGLPLYETMNLLQGLGYKAFNKLSS